MSVKSYLLSVPERLARSTIGVGAGFVREVGEVAIPTSIRRSQLYQHMVDGTLRYLIERVGGVEGTYRNDEQLVSDFLARRTVGNAIELVGIVAFRASPVWVLAALADVCGMGRHLLPEIANALKAEGLLDDDAEFTSVDQILSGLERTSSRVASTMNTPPLDVPALRREWQAIVEAVRSIPPGSLPSRESIRDLWSRLKQESARQEQSVFEIGSTLALSAVATLPDNVRWLSASARLATIRTGHVFATTLLTHYRETLAEIERIGFRRYSVERGRPYVRAAIQQFSPARQTLTQALIERRHTQRGGAARP